MKQPVQARAVTPDEALDFVNHGSASILMPDRSDSTGDGRRGPTLLAPPERRLVDEEAARLRQAIDVAFACVADGVRPPESAVFAINRVLDAGSVRSTLHFAGHRPHLVPRSHGLGPLALLTPLALAAMVLIESVDPHRFRRCAAEDCRVWFVDTSKGGRRRWCSMSTCGNRAKAARYRRKQTGD